MKMLTLIFAIACLLSVQEVHSQNVQFTTPAAGETFRGFDVMQVQWTIQNEPYFYEYLQLSTDGGATYPYMLGMGNVYNDSYSLLLPNVASNNCRITLTCATQDGSNTDTSAVFTITPFPASSLTVNMTSDTTICWFAPLLFEPQISGGQAPYKLVWMGGPGYLASPLQALCDSCNSFYDSLVYYISDGYNYQITLAVTDANGLTGFDSVRVTDYPITHFGYSGQPFFDPRVPCGEEDTVPLSYDTGAQIVSCSWFTWPEDDTVSHNLQLLVTPPVGSTEYILNITDQYGCVSQRDTVTAISLCNTFPVLAEDDCYQLTDPDSVSNGYSYFTFNILGNDVFDTAGGYYGFNTINFPTYYGYDLTTSEWEVWDHYEDGPYIGVQLRAQNGDLSVPDSFQYVLYSEASPNYSDTAWVYINMPCTVDQGLVWPGDANDDGVVTNADLLPIGIGYGTSGIARANATINWTGQSCSNWTDSLTTGLNYKYIDCNGDGIINADDTLAIRQNYSLVHPRGGGQGADSSAPLLIMVPVADTVYNGDTLGTLIVLGDSAIPANNVYGIAFDIDFNPLVTDTSYLDVHFGNSWLGNSSDLLSMTWYFASEGLVRTAVTRYDHTCRSGYGPIGTADFLITTSNINGKDFSYFNNLLSTATITMLDSAGNALAVNAGNNQAWVGYYPAPASAQQLQPNNQVKIFPNPANNRVTISASDYTIGYIKIADLTGGQVMSSPPSGSKSIDIDVSQLANGVYFAEIETGGGTVNKRIVLAR